MLWYVNQGEWSVERGSDMFARVTLTEASPEGVEEAVRHIREAVLPEVRKLQGFKGLYLLLDRETGKQMVIALWETQNDLDASVEIAKRLRAQYVQAAAAQPPKVEVYEVAVQPWGGDMRGNLQIPLAKTNEEGELNVFLSWPAGQSWLIGCR